MADSSSLSNQAKYDVFLNFRGEDRTSFVNHLCASLAQFGITTFTDDDKEESNASWKEIEESRLAIVIFSKSYASSSWCLDELVKIMECSKKNGQLVLPVYDYDFKPSNLRRQGSVFGKLFGKYEMEKVRAWTSALVEAANLSGLLIDHRCPTKHIKEIVDIVLSKLNIDNLNYNKNATGKKDDTLGDTTSSHEKLIGIERRVQQVKELLQVKTVELTQVKTARNSAFASSSPRSSSWTYDVFMCFQGNDICKDFADQLHCALKQQDINVFSNDQALARVESIVSESLKAIEESSIAVVIFSNNYAASSCCLDELVKIMNCNEGIGQMVFPIFYDVDASDVRDQKGLFGEAFMRNKSEKVEIWRKALVKVCSLAGWYLNCTPKGHEATAIKNIVDVISRRLDCLPSSVDDNLIGIGARIKHVMSLLELELGGVHTLGIWGMGGIGKTTLARAVYDQVSSCFDGSCFVENIKEVSKKYGLEHIQKEVLSRLLKDGNLHVSSISEGTKLIRDRLAHRKVLMVFDDVDHKSQLEALAGDHNWFGEGSRIIITTRDEYVLVAHNVKQTYYIKLLDKKESYQFLRRHAFKKEDVTKGYEELQSQVVSYAAGLPLALKVLSSLLCGRSKKEWASTLARLQVFPEKAIQDTLKKSYDSLYATEKELFLDIACFFKGKRKDEVVRILDSCGFYGDDGIRLLEQKSLICISNEHIGMHDLMQQMGREIVRQTHPEEPGKRIRVWRAEDVYDMMDNMSMKEVDAMVVDDVHDQDAVDMTQALRSMKKLRLLQIHSYDKSRRKPLQLSNYLPKELRWLTWKNYPQPSLPTSFKGNKLVGLELLGSSISEPWHGDKFMWRLCFLDLSYSKNLIKTPDFTGTPNLKELKLEFCIRLIDVHESIGYLDRLSLLSFRSCKNLETLPHSFLNLTSLKRLYLDGCSKLKHLPRLMDYQLQFHSDTRMVKVPDSIEFLSNLAELDMSGVRNLSLLPSLPSGIRTLRGIRNLKLLPYLHSTDIRKLSGLRSLRLSDTRNLTSLPAMDTLNLLGLKLPFSIPLDTLADTEQRGNLGSSSDHSLLTDSKTSQELVEYKKEDIPWLPWKGV